MQLLFVRVFFTIIPTHYRLVGDVLLSTGFLSYAGPFNQEFRQSLIQNWKGLLKNRNIPYTNALNVVEMLVDTIETSEWALQVTPSNLDSDQRRLASDFFQ